MSSLEFGSTEKRAGSSRGWHVKFGSWTPYLEVRRTMNFYYWDKDDSGSQGTH